MWQALIDVGWSSHRVHDLEVWVRAIYIILIVAGTVWLMISIFSKVMFEKKENDKDTKEALKIAIGESMKLIIGIGSGIILIPMLFEFALPQILAATAPETT